MNKRCKLRAVCAAGAAAIGVLQTFGFAATTYVGPASGSWELASNWSGGSVPNDPSVDVLVDGNSSQNSTVTIGSATMTVNSLTIAAGDTVSIGQNNTLFANTIQS